MKMSPPRVGEGKRDPGGRCGAPGRARVGAPRQDPRAAARCGVAARLAPSSAPPAGTPLPRGELNPRAPRRCSRQPRWDAPRFSGTLSASGPCPRLRRGLGKQPEHNGRPRLSPPRRHSGDGAAAPMRLALSKAAATPRSERRSAPGGVLGGDWRNAAGFAVKTRCSALHLAEGSGSGACLRRCPGWRGEGWGRRGGSQRPAAPLPLRLDAAQRPGASR